MPTQIVFIKEEGTHPPAEAILAVFAKVLGICSPEDVLQLVHAKPQIVFLDLGMPSLPTGQVLEALRNTLGPSPIITLLDSAQQPDQLMKRLRVLSALGSSRHAPSFAGIVKTMGLSQEALARILGVSARTVHRWLHGTKPRSNAGLEQLTRVAAILHRAMPNREEIHAYLNHPNPFLDGLKPIEVLKRGEYERVIADLEAVEEGVYV